MARYQYQGRNQDGSKVSGMLEAASVDVVANQLSQNGIIPLNIELHEAKEDVLRELRVRMGMDRPTADDLVMFARQCYSLTKAGVPIIKGFKLLADSTRNQMLADAIYQIVGDLEAGRDLASAMARHPKVFDTIFVNVIRVGESSGRLDEAFEQIHDYMERDKETVNQIKSALRYPMFVVIAIVIAVVIVMLFVIPKFSEFYSKNGMELPLPTRGIMAVSNFMVDYWLLLFVLAGSAFFYFRQYINTDAGRLWWDEKKLTFYMIGDIVTRATLGRFARALSMGLKSGVPIIQAITFTSRAVGNEHMSAKIIEIRDGVERGDDLYRMARKANIFTPLVLQMIAVGEETGQLDDMLSEVAEFYERDVDYDVKNLNAIIEPIMTVGMAALVLILMLGVFLPMWDMVKMVQ